MPTSPPVTNPTSPWTRERYIRVSINFPPEIAPRVAAKLREFADKIVETDHDVGFQLDGMTRQLELSIERWNANLGKEHDGDIAL